MEIPILEKALNIVKQNQGCAIVTIVSSDLKGTPRKSGAKMLVRKDGSIFGTIGGGEAEKKAIEEAKKALKRKKTSLITLSFDKRHGYLCGGEVKIFIEPLFPVNRLIICGAGHISLPLSIMAKMQTFYTTVIDNRRDFANKKRFAHADQVICGDFVKTLKKMSVNQNTHIVIVTYGHAHDYACLKTVTGTDAKYIAVIASKMKRTQFFTQLKKDGFSPKEIRKIHAPAGIDIGAQTPEEIAVSIMAEIIAINNRDYMGTEKFQNKT